MQSINLLKEAERVMVICNACRYCEGYCAVFPAMELRKNFLNSDLIYLANLCHDCRGCYYACQYAPPHEFEVNVPKILAELRMETYRDFTWPRFFSELFRRNGLSVALLTAFSIAITLLLVLVFRETSTVFSAHLGEGAFYEVIPFPYLVVPILAICLYALTTLIVGYIGFWIKTGGTIRNLVNPRHNTRAIIDTLRLKNLDGGGHGCNYPNENFSFTRRWFHHLVFYGFMLCLASTMVAAIYDHFLDRVAPYPLWSCPVILGTMGGVALLAGTTGLLFLKWRMHAAPAATRAFGFDIGFLLLLFSTSLTGLLLLAMRKTPAMGMMLALHYAVVFSLFLTLPYGKFVHAIYRYAALLRNAIEQSDKAS